MISNTQL